MRMTWRDASVALLLWALPATTAWPAALDQFGLRRGAPSSAPEATPRITNPTVYAGASGTVYLDQARVGQELTGEGQGLLIPAGARLVLDEGARPNDQWVRVRVPGYQGPGGAELTGWANASTLRPTNEGLPTPGEITADPRSDRSSNAFVQKAREQLGKPYRFGAQGPGEFDCSGLVDFAKKASGLPGNLPRSAKEQAQAVGAHEFADVNQLKAGTLIFYDKGQGVHHVVIKSDKPNMVIEAPNSGGQVQEVQYSNRGEKVTAGEIRGA